MNDHPDLEAQAPDQQAAADALAAALAGEHDAGAPAGNDCRPATLPPLSGAPVSAGEMNLDVILDIPVTLSIELGRTRVPIRNLLQLNQGSVVELDRIAGEPLDVLVNGTLIAHGEAVVVNEKFGIRLTDVVSPSERVRRLK
ncbi:MAG: flagellar motor switch protein FliN [Pseudomonadales bacterium]|nr:flagellar motor switch protein FliN [Pseudomonadales bacterium]